MDGEHFDSLMRTLASHMRRRAVTATLAGGALAVLLGWNAPEGDAKKRRKKRRKPPPCTRTCAGKGCGDPDGCGGTCTACPSGQTCQGSQGCVPDVCDPPCRGAHVCKSGACVCPQGMESCDVNFCGECCGDSECPGFPGLHRQRCFCFDDTTCRCACGTRGEPPCPDGRCGICCNDAFCEATQGPGRFCTVDLTCACRAGLTHCSTELGCVDTMTNPEACGPNCQNCRLRFGPSFSCVNGACCTNACGSVIIPGQPCCAGTCTDRGPTFNPQYVCA